MAGILLTPTAYKDIMTSLTQDGRARIAEIARTHGVSPQAAEEMALAVARGGGTMAQFSIPELGGSGQWMAGGMTMVGNMFDTQLQARVSGLCTDLAGAIAQGGMLAQVQPTQWWPADLGVPSSQGGQNLVRYAWFPQARRIAVDPGTGGPIVLLDTGDHQIGGFSQQQSGTGDPFAGISFSSQLGQFALSSLPRVDAAARAGDSPSHRPAVPSMPSSQGQHPDPARSATGPAPAGDHQAPALSEASSDRSIMGTPQTPSGLAGTQSPQTGPQRSSSPGDAAAQPSARVAADATAPTQASDILTTIERLAGLRDAGILSEEEFKAKKAELLARL